MNDPPTTHAPFVLRLFGPCQVLVRGAAIPPLRSRKGLWLLGLLALRHGCAVEREWLAGTLWPDSMADGALASLRQTLTDLRHALGAEAGRLQAPSRRFVQLDVAGADIDLLAFDAALAAPTPSPEDLRSAITLHRGVLLESCAIDEVALEREARRQAYLRAIESLAGHEADLGSPSEAARLLRLAASAEPFDERIHCSLMRALAAGGDGAGLIEAHRAMRARLRREINIDVAPETAALFDALRVSLTGADPGIGRRRSGDTPAPVRHMPAPATSLIGRDDDARDVVALVLRERLVVLTGSGGVGKTRLAVRVAGDLLDQRPGLFPDGAWMVDLSSITEPTMAADAVRVALRAMERQGRPAEESVLDFLRTRRLLLLLDNCEHLIDAASALAERIVAECAGVRLLATSRERLRAGGEFVWRVGSLAVPDPVEAASDPVRAREAASVALFVERAARVTPGFELTQGNAADSVRLCRLLDGIPLALELAAARTVALSVRDLADRLADGLRLLDHGPRSAPPRHRTLRRAIDWSYALLDAAGQSLLARLAVFSDGWTLEAAEAICPFPPGAVDANEVPALLSGLVEMSLVDAGRPGGEDRQGRYTMLQTVRQYGLERLEASGDASDPARQHARWFAAWAEALEPALKGPEQVAVVGRMEADLGNLRAAFQSGDPHLRLRLVAALQPFFSMRGRLAEGRRWSERAVTDAREEDDIPLPLRARVLNGLGIIARQQGDLEGGQHHLTESLRFRRQIGDRLGTAACLSNLAGIAADRLDFAGAADLHTEALAIARELGDEYGVAMALSNLGAAHANLGDLRAARACQTESLTLRERFGDTRGVAYSRFGLGDVDRAERRWEQARRHYAVALRLLHSLGDTYTLAPCLGAMGHSIAELGEPDRGARLFAAEARLLDALHGTELRHVDGPTDLEVDEIRAALGETAFQAAWREGYGWTVEQALAHAIDD